LAYFGCKTNLGLPDNQLVTQIIMETIKQDSLDRSLSISKELINYFLYKVEPEKNNDTIYPPPPPPPAFFEKGKPLALYYFRLNQQKIIGYNISKEDSINFERQISNKKNIELDTAQLKEILQLRNQNKTEFYEFLLPLFNRDKTLAWVEYNHRCTACGEGKMVIFRKTNNRWLKIASYWTWEN
jgi:hypothetical protein